MKQPNNPSWTVLIDNRTHDSRLATEHGLSILLHTSRHTILLDTGASHLFCRNAETLGVDLTQVDYVFISHGHSDHAGGLKYFLQLNDHAPVIVSPHALTGQFYSERGRMHSITPVWPDNMQSRLLTVDYTHQIAPGLHVIAHIPQVHPMPLGNRHLFVKDAGGRLVSDDFRHELALYADGLLFTGCAHSGLENILAACPWPVHTVVGGFHLLDGQETEAELHALATRLTSRYPDTQFYTSHCTGDQAFCILQSGFALSHHSAALHAL